MLSVHADGENRHRLENGARAQVGWIRGRAIGFGGFTSERGAMRAALVGSRALQTALRREYPGWPRQDSASNGLRLVHDGAYEWVTDGIVPIARLLRGRADVIPVPPLGIEYVLPSFASEGVAIMMAQALARALQPHLPELRAASSASSASTAEQFLPDDAA